MPVASAIHDRADELYVVTCVNNPVPYQSRYTLYDAFEKHMLDSGVNLTTVECAYGDHPYVCDKNPKVNHVKVRANSILWIKENLMNIGLAHLPHTAKYIAFIDADITFRNTNWASMLVHKHQFYPVVQPWSQCLDLGPSESGPPAEINLHNSLAYNYTNNLPIVQGPNATNSIYKFAHPGFAISWTRQALDWAGNLLDMAILGAADHHMMMALIGRVEDTIPKNVTAGYKNACLVWQSRVLQHINKRLGCVPGIIEHSWHGPKNLRQYVNRWNILYKHSYDPATDIKHNPTGVLELAGNKPDLNRDVAAYFAQRNEDSNSLS